MTKTERNYSFALDWVNRPYCVELTVGPAETRRKSSFLTERLRCENGSQDQEQTKIFFSYAVFSSERKQIFGAMRIVYWSNRRSEKFRDEAEDKAKVHCCSSERRRKKWIEIYQKTGGYLARIKSWFFDHWLWQYRVNSEMLHRLLQHDSLIIRGACFPFSSNAKASRLVLNDTARTDAGGSTDRQTMFNM